MRARMFSALKSRWAVAGAAMTLAVGLGAAASPMGHADQPGLLRVRFGGDATTTRVVVELSKSAQAKLISAGQPVVIELPRIDAGDERQGAGQGLVRAWTAEGGAGST